MESRFGSVSLITVLRFPSSVHVEAEALWPSVPGCDVREDGRGLTTMGCFVAVRVFFLLVVWRCGLMGSTGIIETKASNQSLIIKLHTPSFGFVRKKSFTSEMGLHPIGINSRTGWNCSSPPSSYSIQTAWLLGLVKRKREILSSPPLPAPWFCQSSP